MIENEGEMWKGSHHEEASYRQAKEFELDSVDRNLQKGFKQESNINRYAFSKASS